VQNAKLQHTHGTHTRQHHSHIKPDSNHLHQQVGFKHTLFGTQLPINIISSACFYVCLTHFLKQEIWIFVH